MKPLHLLLISAVSELNVLLLPLTLLLNRALPCGVFVVTFYYLILNFFTYLMFRSTKFFFKSGVGRVQWLMPVIPALWEAEVDGSLEVRSLRLAWPTC